MDKSVVLYLHVHQPYRLKEYSLFDIRQDSGYFDSNQSRLSNQKILKKVALKSYLPANELFLKLLTKHKDFHLSLSISGVLIEQCQQYAPEVLESFQRLVDTGKVELIAETYYHSLSFLHSHQEFFEQINLHTNTLKKHFGVMPTAFRNTELIYSNDIAKLVANLGFKTILAEGVERHLKWRSPNYVYLPKNTSNLTLLLKNYRLSDDIAFRFSSKEWQHHPLSSSTYASWVNQTLSNGHIVNLFMDYETFGEHQWADTGIFDFMATLPSALAQYDISFKTISQAAEAYEPMDQIDIPELTSWADTERDLSAWIGNQMQQQALDALFELEDHVKATKDIDLLHDWRRLTTSDHFYYMCTKWFADGDVHKYFSPYNHPFEAFTTFMNVLHDVRARLSDYQGTINAAHAYDHSKPIH